MKLKEFLESSGWSKAAVARHLGISPPAVALWDDIPEKHLSSLVEEIDSPPPEPKKKVELSDFALLEVIRTRGSVSDFDICRAHGWRIPEFNQMIADLTKKYPLDGESCKTHSFWAQVKGSCES